VEKNNSDFKNLGRLLKITDLNPLYFMLPVGLLFLSAAIQGVGMALLIPTIKGVIQMDYSFVETMPLLKIVSDFIRQTNLPFNTSLFALLIVLITGMLILSNILSFFGGLLADRKLIQFHNRLRKAIYKRYISFGKLFFDQHNAGHLHTILLGFSGRIMRSLGAFQSALQACFTLAVYLGIMLWISWHLTLFVLLVFPILFFATQWIIQKIKASSRRQSKASLELGRKVSNALSCIPLVKAYSNENEEFKWFSYTCNRDAAIQFGIKKKQRVLKPLQEIIMLLLTLLVVIITSFLLLKNGIGDLASFMVFFYILRKSGGSIAELNQLRTSLAEIHGPLTEISVMFENKDEYLLCDGSKEFPGMKKEVLFNKLTFSYRENLPILKDLTFVVEKGKTTAIVGATGAGKTSAINLLMRFYNCQRGMITIDAVDINDFTLKSLRQHMALVSQETLLFNASLRINLTYGLEDRNNLTYGLNEEISDEKLMEVLRKARLYDFVMSLPKRLETEVGDRGVKLSGGEKQRVAIARAILKDPQILFLDEATSALDSITEQQIQEALTDLMKDRTALVVAHRLSTIRHADKIVVIEKGRLDEQGTLEELLEKKGKFYKYWEEQKFY